MPYGGLMMGWEETAVPVSPLQKSCQRIVWNTIMVMIWMDSLTQDIKDINGYKTWWLMKYMGWGRKRC